MTSSPLSSGIDARTRLFAIVGNPIDHVRAPVVWSALFRKFGINAVFLPAHVEPGRFDEAITGLKALKNLDGLMFTMPHKQAALRHADTVTERARRVGSLNLIRPNADGSWTGDNVDGAGFIAGLLADGVRINGIHAYIHGTGGVGQTIAWALASEAIVSLALFDLDVRRATQLADAIQTETGVEVRVGTSGLDRFDLLVNATPMGLHEGDALAFSVTGLKPTAVVADVIMEPMHTRLLVEASRLGLKVHHGRHMMTHALPLAAQFYGLDPLHGWDGTALQNADA